MCDTHSEQINELAKALAAAQGELEPAEKNSTAAVGKEGKLKRKYADLTAMIDAVRKVLPKHGLSIAQIVLPSEGVAHVRTMLMHESGQWLASECRMPYDNTGSKNAIQSMGSAITYARRYSLSALVGVVADDDDDGEGAWRRDDDREPPRRNAPEPAPQSKPERVDLAAVKRKIAVCQRLHRAEGFGDVPHLDHGAGRGAVRFVCHRLPSFFRINYPLPRPRPMSLHELYHDFGRK